MLSAGQVAQFHEQGFLVLPGFSSATDMLALRRRIEGLLADFQPSNINTVFSTTKQACLWCIF
jgi:phytanoyl-CoA hydroxylase